MSLYFELMLSCSTAEKGICQFNKYGDVIHEFFFKDAILVHEIKDESNNDYGKVYAYFIIECQDGDYVKYIENKQLCMRAEESFYKDSFMIESEQIGEIYASLIKQNMPLPEFTSRLLKDNLNILFDGGFIVKARDYDNIWQNYLRILKYLKKNVSEFVSQEKIDSFLLNLAQEWALKLFDSIASTITLSSKVKNAYETAQKEFQDAIISAEKLIATKSYKNLSYGGPFPSFQFHLTKPPCREISVNGFLADYHALNITVVFGSFITTIVDISEQCKKFEKNFLCKK